MDMDNVEPSPMCRQVSWGEVGEGEEGGGSWSTAGRLETLLKHPFEQNSYVRVCVARALKQHLVPHMTLPCPQPLCLFRC